MNNNFILNPLFNQKYYKFIIGNDKLQKWFEENQETLISIRCITLQDANEILNHTRHLPENSKLNKLEIIRLATIIETLFKKFEYFSSKNELTSNQIHQIASNLNRQLESINQKFEVIKIHPERMEIRNFDQEKIIDILRAVYNGPKYYIGSKYLKDYYIGALSPELTFKMESHTMQSGFEEPDNCYITLYLNNDILTIWQAYSNEMPKDATNIYIHAFEPEVIDRIHNQIQNITLKLK